MANRNIFIAGRGNSVARISHDAVAGKAFSKEFTGVVPASVPSATRINALAVIVDTMETLLTKKEAGTLEGETTPTLILTLSLVTDIIENGTFKYWLKNGGKKMDGTPINEVELACWSRFAELYKELYLDLTFKNISNVKLDGRRGGRNNVITMEDRTLDEYAKKVWEKVAVTPEVIEEEDSDAF